MGDVTARFNEMRELKQRFSNIAKTSAKTARPMWIEQNKKSWRIHFLRGTAPRRSFCYPMCGMQ
jgi:hypothetical protein